VIRSFMDGVTEAVFHGRCPKGFPADIFSVARRKLANRLEALKKDRKGEHSIRINDQWRLCFRWTKNGPEDVEIVDYH
jgi:proteic killer suppression protein